MHDFLIAAVSFVVLLGVMVVVHEFGHFAVAKLCGVRVEAFSVGMGPRLFGVKYGETDYRICAFPIGGYVKMTGESPEDEANGLDAPEDPGAFTAHPRWQRMLIGLAGPVSNFILAFVLMLGYYWFLNEVPPYFDKPVTLDLVLPGTEAAKAGLLAGDEIVSFDSTQAPTYEQLLLLAAPNLNHTVPLTVARQGLQIKTELYIASGAKAEDFSLEKLGLIPRAQVGFVGVDRADPSSPAAEAGLLRGDRIVAFDGLPLHFTNSLLPYLQARAGKPMILTVLRNGQTLTLTAHPRELGVAEMGGVWRLGFAGIPPPEHAKPLDFVSSVRRSIAYSRDNSLLIVRVLGKVLSNQMSVKTLSGPVGMAQMAGDAAQSQGYFPKFGLAAAISINLGILNLLPIPILDGGLILLLLIEGIRRKDLSIVVKERIYQTAFVMLILLFAFIIFNDVSKLSIFARLKL